ncbi:hypothetical protein QQP08_008997 [Theobroma cacao]|nr:hypothetical protein QQP08_008997 [Theobroma cacao]
MKYGLGGYEIAIVIKREDSRMQFSCEEWRAEREDMSFACNIIVQHLAGYCDYPRRNDLSKEPPVANWVSKGPIIKNKMTGAVQSTNLTLIVLLNYLFCIHIFRRLVDDFRLERKQHLQPKQPRVRLVATKMISSKPQATQIVSRCQYKGVRTQES